MYVSMYLNHIKNTSPGHGRMIPTDGFDTPLDEETRRGAHSRNGGDEVRSWDLVVGSVVWKAGLSSNSD